MTIRMATTADRQGVVSTLTAAFAHDAIVRFLFPLEETYEHRAGLFFGHYFDVRIAGGEVFVVDDGAGAALWNPPGGNRLGAAFVREHWERTFVAAVTPEEVSRYEDFTEVLHAMTPEVHHWYLGLLGVTPERQGSGIASSLLDPMLARADAELSPIFLETGMLTNLDFYSRFGFASIADADVPGGPHVWGLVRPPNP